MQLNVARWLQLKTATNHSDTIFEVRLDTNHLLGPLNAKLSRWRCAWYTWPLN